MGHITHSQESKFHSKHKRNYFFVGGVWDAVFSLIAEILVMLSNPLAFFTMSVESQLEGLSRYEKYSKSRAVGGTLQWLRVWEPGWSFLS